MDALSDDGKYGLTIIGFVGSVFSPYYLRARKQGKGDPANHCAINVALYGKNRRWAMTERGKSHVTRSANSFIVGPSSMKWTAEGLVIDINEICAPIPFPIRGTVRIQPEHLYDKPVCLDENGGHYWRAVAPKSRATVELSAPSQSWSGSAYLDMNWGDEPLENAFRTWSWLRTQSNSATTVLYDVQRRAGSDVSFGKTFNAGEVRDHTMPQAAKLKKGFWGMPRPLLSEVSPTLLATFEDAPFYTRNKVEITLGNAPCEAVHESLSLDRFIHPIVQLMLPFKMPRRR